MLDRDLSQMHTLERAAVQKGLKYVHISDFPIGLISNSAGSCMATMDFLTTMGLEAANFMDIGGQARAEKIQDAFNLLD